MSIAKFDSMAKKYDGRSRPMYSPKRVSRILGIPYSTLMAEIAAGRLAAFVPPGRTRGYGIAGEDIDKWIKEGTCNA